MIRIRGKNNDREKGDRHLFLALYGCSFQGSNVAASMKSEMLRETMVLESHLKSVHPNAAT
jgi:hypothetical protein